MKLLISGGTGLTGQGVLPLLKAGDHDIRCLVRQTSAVERLGSVELAYGDATDEESLVRALDGMDAFLHIAGIQHAPGVISAMRRAGAGRLVIVSSTSAHSRFEHRSGPRLRNEALVRESGLSWTIVRPSMIYGCELDKNIRRLLLFLDRFPAYPVFGPGTNLWQPVYYKDLAGGIVAALERPEAAGQIYDLPGKEPLTYANMAETAAAALGKKVRIVRLPLEPVRLTLAAAERFGLPLPIKSEQVLRLREDKAYPYDKASRELGYRPRSFPEGVALEVARLRELGMLRTRRP